MRHTGPVGKKEGLTVMGWVGQEDNQNEQSDESVLVTVPSTLSLAEAKEVQQLRDYRWFEDENYEKAKAIGRKAKLAASTGAACDWESFRDEMLSIYYYDQACRACSLDNTFHPLPANWLSSSIIAGERTFRLQIRPLTWTGSSPEAAIKRVHDINTQAPPDGFFMADHVERYWGTDPSDRLAQPPPVGATVYACYGCWVIEVARWWNRSAPDRDPEVRSGEGFLFPDKWRAQKFLQMMKDHGTELKGTETTWPS
jgi:hypothetical protein